jgi:hypothetical protein
MGTVRINVQHVIDALVTSGKGKQTTLDGTSLENLQQARTAGRWETHQESE